jgi:glycosyltransferase involved in cell wall biosynthesis
MRILFVVDGRSPISLNWIRYYSESEHEVHVVSTYPCSPELRLASLHLIQAAFSNAVGEKGIRDKEAGRQEGLRGLTRKLVPVGWRTSLRQWLGPLTLPAAARSLRLLVEQIQPDLVHAMRIPYEGMLAALALSGGGGHTRGGHMVGGNTVGRHVGPPLLLSVWGNDFTLHARATPRMASLTRLALDAATALHTDCRRDIRLAHQWGFNPAKPSIVLPGGGGVQTDLFYPDLGWVDRGIGDKGEGAFVLNPRGFRAYVRNDSFFRAIPLVLKELPEVHFICPGMAGEPQAEGWIEKLGIQRAVELTPLQTRPQMADLFRQSQVAVSPSTHDGTPNTLLEAMASGCFPIAGDIESLQEWITPGSNGMLVDPRDPRALAEAILCALRDPNLRARAREHNLRLVAERAEYGRVMEEAERFYQGLISQ